MKRDFVRTVLKGGNAASLSEAEGQPGAMAVYAPLLLLIADCLDLAVAGEDVWLTLGLTRNRDAVLLTVHDGNNKYTAGGDSLKALAADCARLL